MGEASPSPQVSSRACGAGCREGRLAESRGPCASKAMNMGLIRGGFQRMVVDKEEKYLAFFSHHNNPRCLDGGSPLPTGMEIHSRSPRQLGRGPFPSAYETPAPPRAAPRPRRASHGTATSRGPPASPRALPGRPAPPGTCTGTAERCALQMRRETCREGRAAGLLPLHERHIGNTWAGETQGGRRAWPGWEAAPDQSPLLWAWASEAVEMLAALWEKSSVPAGRERSLTAAPTP